MADKPTADTGESRDDQRRGQPRFKPEVLVQFMAPPDIAEVMKDREFLRNLFGAIRAMRKGRRAATG